MPRNMLQRAHKPGTTRPPARDWETLSAAVANGADEVYFGLCELWGGLSLAQVRRFSNVGGLRTGDLAFSTARLRRGLRIHAIQNGRRASAHLSVIPEGVTTAVRRKSRLFLEVAVASSSPATFKCALALRTGVQ